ncbi:hypothetical protein EYF80_032449 [Liparis tanakae]|uniref:Uncharacterized protein n=1 Tax=Liparis tanakae TaxID=230148 RepID=A0A4Z2GX76_9TELE|nr:hypothetical protein EYF80_032449 [Liparis tanakae]
MNRASSFRRFVSSASRTIASSRRTLRRRLRVRGMVYVRGQRTRAASSGLLVPADGRPDAGPVEEGAAEGADLAAGGADLAAEGADLAEAGGAAGLGEGGAAGLGAAGGAAGLGAAGGAAAEAAGSPLGAAGVAPEAPEAPEASEASEAPAGLRTGGVTGAEDTTMAGTPPESTRGKRRRSSF